jgi:hypothetical protein
MSLREAHLETDALADPALPGAGEAFWYLVRARGGCGESGVGSGTLGPRVLPSEPCP